MEFCGSRILVALVVLLSYFISDFCCATDTITSSQSIQDPGTIISNGGTFRMGFFSPGNSTNCYVGIWFNDVSPTIVVWVANWNKPLNDSSGIVTVSEDGNLVVLNGQKEVLWSSNVLNSAGNISTGAQLLDSGNLVLREKSKRTSLWESFLEPTDTFLPTMKLTTNIRTGEKVQLTSWKSPSDPSVGRFSGGVDPSNVPEVFIWKDNKPLWRSGPWNGRVFLGIPNMTSVYLNGYNLVVDNQEGIASYSFAFSNNSMLFHVLNSEGILEVRDWIPGKKNWEVIYLLPTDVCDAYGNCGAFGICDSLKKPICSCLRGFEPKNVEEWGRGNWTSGCVRRSPLQCGRINKTGEVGKEDGFLKQEKLKLPDFVEWSSIPQHKCREQCLNNCSCMAYAFHVGIGCMTWGGNLIDTAKMSSDNGDVYIRVSHSELGKKDFKVIVIVIVLVGSVAVAICTFFFWKWKAKHKASKNKNKLLGIDQRTAEFSSENIDLVKFQDLPLFNFRKLATATNNFHLNNKLGQGGFGPVYNGISKDGQEIVVKRLSNSSRQGLEEFMNEVMLISKLQHSNLVRLFGCYVEGEEKMLIYEHMPNKSLDAFLFDLRLRIIHGDLKASNILLDEELNAKISDFGMTRMFKGNQDQANTARIVGTYGYMSPEYTVEWRFSEKSDVFSFRVLLLEIVSGRRNSSFYHDENCLTLLGFAWKLWNENNIVTFIDSAISKSCSHLQIIRCIHVGLLCVQEFAKDRPTVSTIISMLGTEIVDLPAPKQPAFTARQNVLDTESSEQGQRRCSINHVTITAIDGR